MFTVHDSVLPISFTPQSLVQKKKPLVVMANKVQEKTNDRYQVFYPCGT
jgi:hypothetical protein